MRKSPDSRLARRKVAALEKEGADLAPIAFVLPPIAAILQSIQAVGAAEVDRMREMQHEIDDKTQRPRGLTLDDVKKLSGLTAAIVESHKAEKSLSEKQLGKMSDADINAAILEAAQADADKAGAL